MSRMSRLISQLSLREVEMAGRVFGPYSYKYSGCARMASLYQDSQKV